MAAFVKNGILKRASRGLLILELLIHLQLEEQFSASLIHHPTPREKIYQKKSSWRMLHHSMVRIQVIGTMHSRDPLLYLLLERQQ